MKDKGLLDKIVTQTVDIPSLPTIAAKVLQLVDNDIVSVTELENIISKDQSFSTRLLRIANSSYFRRGREIDTISTAIMLIGFNTMRSLIVGISMRDLGRYPGPFEAMLWEHSLGVSLAASHLALETGLMNPEEALVAGLIHDVGKTVLHNSMPSRYDPLIIAAYEQGVRSADVEDRGLGFTHCDVGAIIARKWKFPRNLAAVIEFHHVQTLPPLEDPNLETPCQIVQIADAMCLNLGIGLHPVATRRVEHEILGIGTERFVELSQHFAASYKEQRQRLLDAL